MPMLMVLSSRVDTKNAGRSAEHAHTIGRVISKNGNSPVEPD